MRSKRREFWVQDAAFYILSSYNHLTIIGAERLDETRTEDGYAQGNGLHGSNQPTFYRTSLRMTLHKWWSQP